MDETSRFDRPPNGKIFQLQDSHLQHDQPLFPQLRIHPDFMPNGSKSLARISEHALGLGITLGVCSLITIQLVYDSLYLWRIPFFVSILSVFHYLEFDMTARYNPTDAKVSSFLLFTNGRAYNIAHTAAIVEILVRHILKSYGYLNFTLLPRSNLLLLPHFPFSSSVVIGLALVILGQTFRSLAMKQAGTSFNHVVQSAKKEDHILVTSGVYSISRHPAYFGFFWWGIGTQILLGNPLCFVAYSVILWKFFAHRIMHEEKHLIGFFGDDYEAYRKKTPVLIPLIG